MIEARSVRVLLVEDNELDRRMVVHQLTSHPDVRFDVEWATTLTEALRLATDLHFDCVLLDLTLPDSTGLASVDAMLDRPDPAPVVVLSGLDDPLVALEAVQRGAQDYLTKRTMDAELLARAIGYAITRFAAETELHTTRELLNLMHERERIARDLQDTVIQMLFATGLGLQALAARTDDGPVRTRLLESADEVDAAIHQLREAIFNIYKTADEVTVADELGQVAGAAEGSLGFRPTIRVVPGIDGIGRELRHRLMTAAGEALANVAKHAEATAVQVIAEFDGNEVALRVIDNGRGFAADVEPSIGYLDGQRDSALERRTADLSADMEIRPGPGGGAELIWRAHIFDRP
ncbi:MAG: response regulator [Acidimicrobiia bacterium]|nr:response regulator [Acidimicrobiia bacterium]